MQLLSDKRLWRSILTTYLKGAYYLPIWFIPVVLFNSYRLFSSDFSTLGSSILCFVLSIIIVLGLSSIASTIHEAILDDVVSEEAPFFKSF